MHDARAYARRVRAQATLTGACIIALGNDYGGMWSSFWLPKVILPILP